MSRGPALTILLCFAMGVLEGFDIQVLGVTAPHISRSLGLDAAAMTLVYFASNLGLLIGAFSGGWLADLRGRRPVIIGSAIIFGVFTLVTAGTATLPALLTARLLAGLGLGAALPNMVAVAAAVSRPERLARTTAAMFCGTPLGGAAVALVSQHIEGIDWRMLFIVGGILPLVVAAAQWLYLPETLAAVVPTGPVGRILLGSGRWRATILLWLTVAPTLMALYLILYWLPTLLIQRGFASSLATEAAAIFSLSGVVGALTIGILVDRIGSQLVCGGGYLIFGAVALQLAGVEDATSMLLLSGMAGFLILGLNYAVYGLAGSVYPEAGRATGTGAALSVGRLGAILGPTLSGALIVVGAGPGDILRLLAPIAAVAAAAVFALGAVRASASRIR